MSKALNIHWSYGFNKDVLGGVHSLTSKGRNALFYPSSHSGVIYDFEHRTQMILQGHRNKISCCAVSHDKRWIVTSDHGDDSILVVWDSLTGAPVKTIFTPHSTGVVSVDISSDSMFVITLSAVDENNKQEVAIWAWTREEEDPILRKEIFVPEKHHAVRFDHKNQGEFATTGSTTVIFWSWEEMQIEGYVARVSKADFGSVPGHYTCTVFLPGTMSALTATSEGFVLLWENQYTAIFTEGTANKNTKSASKVLRLVDTGVRTLDTTPNGYLVAGCADGAVRFFDFFFRLEAWFEDLSAGPVTSVSFSIQDCPFDKGDAGAPGLKFWVPDFVVATADAFVVGVESSIFDEVRPEERRGVLLMQGIASDITSVACHPSRPLVAFSSADGSLQMWNYDMKLLMNLRVFNEKSDPSFTANPKTAAATERSQTARTQKEHQAKGLMAPNAISFHPGGEILVVGFNNGIVKFLSVESLEDIGSAAPSTDSVLALKFSPSGDCLAGCDGGDHVFLFKKQAKANVLASFGQKNDDGVDGPQEFTYVGRIHSHRERITGIEFGYREGVELLLSLSEDRRCVEYDIETSCLSEGVLPYQAEGAPNPCKVESAAKPIALVWHPRTEDDSEDKFVISTDEFKLKEFNADSKQCRRTTLAPTFGGPPNSILPVRNIDGTVGHYVYSTHAKVIGLGCFPLCGDPAKVMGLVAHPQDISAIAISFDGKFVFSGGGADLSVNMWAVDTSALDDANVYAADHDYGRYDGGSDEMKCGSNNPDVAVATYLPLLEGGAGGELHQDIVDYFYYCQIRAQGEDSMEKRAIVGKIPLEEVPSLMRAVGYYPSEEEVANMLNEVRYRSFMTTGDLHNTIDLPDFIKLYINHRPVLPLNYNNVAKAFETIQEGLNSPEYATTWGQLRRLLVSEGETISPEDLEAYLAALVGAGGGSTGGLASLMEDSLFDANSFAEHILGFEQT